MKRHIPGLHQQAADTSDILEGAFLVCIARASYHWHPRRPFYVVQFIVLEPKDHKDHCLTGRLYCTPKALWKLNWLLRDFAYDSDLISKDEIDERALLGLRGVVRVSRSAANGRPYLNLDGFASAGAWEGLRLSTASQEGGL